MMDIFLYHLGQIVDMSLVNKLVVRGSGAALMDAEEVFLGNIWLKKTKKGTKRLGDKVSQTFDKAKFAM